MGTGASEVSERHLGEVRVDTRIPVRAEPLSDQGFAAAVAAVTSAFGDPTRRHMYTFAAHGYEARVEARGSSFALVSSR